MIIGLNDKKLNKKSKHSNNWKLIKTAEMNHLFTTECFLSENGKT